jgi:hypothetical protein
MPTPLPARNIFDGTALPVTSTMKTTMGNLRDFLAGLLGTTGAAVDARAALGVPDPTLYTTAGTSTAYTITPNPAIAAYAANQTFLVSFNAASGASPTLQISGVATPPNLVKQLGDGTFVNIGAGDIPVNFRSRVTLLSATQALVELIPRPGRLIGAPRVITAGSSVYTPTPGTTSIEVEVQGGGGAGGGLPSTAAGQNGAAAGGSAGAYARSYITTGFSGVTMTVGAAGAGVVAASGGNGGTTSFGALVSAPGGIGGGGGAGFVVGGYPTLGGPSARSAVATGGSILNRTGDAGGAPSFITVDRPLSGGGGSSHLGGGGSAQFALAATGLNGDGYGAGGGGAAQTQSSAVNLAGGNGTQGVIIIHEYA